MPRYDIEKVRESVVEIAAALGLIRSDASIWARRLLWHETLGRAEEGLGGLPSVLEKFAEGALDPRAEPQFSPLPGDQGVRIRADRALPAIVLARARESAGQLARSRGPAQLGVVRVSGLDPASPVAAEVADLAIGPNEAFAFGSDDRWVGAWPTDLGLPLSYDSTRARQADAVAGVATLELPRMPDVPRSDEGEIVIVARSLAPERELRQAHERIRPFLATAERPDALGYLHPEVWRRKRTQAATAGLTLSAATVAGLASWSRRLGLKPLLPMEDPEAERSW